MNAIFNVRLFFAIAIIFLFVQCTSNRSSNAANEKGVDKNAVQNIHLPETGETTLNASSFADTVIYIPLETRKESLISSINQIWMNASVILVSSMDGLFQFRRDGKFNKRIGKQGKGPGEYLDIYHFEVVRDTIYVSSTGRRGFKRYTLDGKFCDEIKLSIEPVYFTTTVNGKLAIYIREEGKIVVYNHNFNSPDTIVVEYAVTVDRYRYSQFDTGRMPYLQKTGTGLLFNSYCSDTIWNISGNKKEPAYILNLKDKRLPYDKQIEFSKGDFERWNEIVKPYQYEHLIQFPSMTFILQMPWSIRRQDYNAIYIHDNHNGEIKRYNISCVYDDITGHQKLMFFYPSYSGKYLISSVKSEKIAEYLSLSNEEKSDLSQAVWIKQMKNIKEEDNPILALMIIKKKL